jgi:RimJ/RimL family protein N-acetyltransferase
MKAQPKPAAVSFATNRDDSVQSRFQLYVREVVTMLDLQPTLVGPHITLRPLAAQDFQDLFGIASDPLLWAQHPDPARGTREGFPLFFAGALNSQGCLVAIDTMRESVIGWSRYTDYERGKRVAIGSTFLARSQWGGMANAEMKRLMLHHAFTDVPEVLLTVAERNRRSRRAVEKLGAELVGAEDAPRWGQVHVIYRVTPDLWVRRAESGYGPEAGHICTA